MRENGALAGGALGEGTRKFRAARWCFCG